LIDNSKITQKNINKSSQHLKMSLELPSIWYKCFPASNNHKNLKSPKWLRPIRYNWRNTIKLYKMKASPKVRSQLKSSSSSTRINWIDSSQKRILMEFVKSYWVLESTPFKSRLNSEKIWSTNLSETIYSR